MADNNPITCQYSLRRNFFSFSGVKGPNCSPYCSTRRNVTSAYFSETIAVSPFFSRLWTLEMSLESSAAPILEIDYDWMWNEKLNMNDLHAGAAWLYSKSAQISDDYQIASDSLSRSQHVCMWLQASYFMVVISRKLQFAFSVVLS